MSPAPKGVTSSRELHQAVLGGAVALNVALGRRQRAVADEFLDVAKRSARLYQGAGGAGHEGAASGMRSTAGQPSLGVDLGEPVDQTAGRHVPASLRSNDRAFLWPAIHLVQLGQRPPQ